jgi:putative membrane protein
MKKYTPLIVLLSVTIPIVVAILYLVPKQADLPTFIKQLPKLNALINGTTFFMLIAGLLAIKNKNIKRHKFFMWSALTLSVVFLLSYVTYHALAPNTHYGGEGFMKYVYFFVLFSHILLSAVIVPLVLITLSRALSEKYDKHKKIAKITLPLWLYVALTGVLVYIMISPYYPQ